MELMRRRAFFSPILLLLVLEPLICFHAFAGSYPITAIQNAISTPSENQALYRQASELTFPCQETHGSGIVFRLSEQSPAFTLSANHVMLWRNPDGSEARDFVYTDERAAPVTQLNLKSDLDSGLSPRVDKKFSARALFIPAHADTDLTFPRASHDFAVGIADGLKESASIVKIGSPQAQAKVIYAGYPQVGNPNLNLVAGEGEILSDAEATRLVAADLEGVPKKLQNRVYRPEDEFVIRGVAIPGMSGGPVFGLKGELIGVLDSTIVPPGISFQEEAGVKKVVSTEALRNQSYARVIRADRIFSRLATAIEKLSEKEASVLEARRAMSAQLLAGISACSAQFRDLQKNKN